MKNPGIRYGIIAFIITVIWTIAEHFLGWNTTNHETGQYARLMGSFIFYFLVIVAIYQRRKQQGGRMSFGEGFSTGATVSVIYAAGCVLLYSVYGELINTQYKPTLMAFERSKLEAAHASPDAIAAKMKQVDLSSGGSVLSYLLLFVFMFIFGAVIAVIVSLILKRNKVSTNKN
ncbi:MAG: DUF4199 domain-containing protein [Chitinophagaceae bacterium]|nr:DUF4199 domain-containing protein [Chitinophagaceae bacterium]